jgi:hypothetical protein
MSIDPEILIGLQNSRENQLSINLQGQILEMQKLQVLNQIRISQGLQPLAELPKPPPPPPIPLSHVIANVIGSIIFTFLVFSIIIGGLWLWANWDQDVMGDFINWTNTHEKLGHLHSGRPPLGLGK